MVAVLIWLTTVYHIMFGIMIAKKRPPMFKIVGRSSSRVSLASVIKIKSTSLISRTSSPPPLPPLLLM